MTTSTTERQGTQILIVEDDEDSRRALTNALEDQGYTVAALDSGAAALDYLRGSPHPSLILLDLVMSGMDGWEFRHKQTQDPQLAGIPVISVSAVGKLVDVDVSLRKPLDYDELIGAVGRYVPRAGRPKPANRKPKHTGRSKAR